MRRIRRTTRSDLGATAAEYAAVLLVVAGVVGAVIVARLPERTSEGVRVALCRMFTSGPCETGALEGGTAAGGPGDSGAAGGPSDPGAAGGPSDPGAAGGPSDPGAAGGPGGGDGAEAVGTEGGGAGPGGFLQTSLITTGPLAATPLNSPGDPLDPFSDEDTGDDQGWLTDPGVYARQDATFQGHQFRVRGYLNPKCLRNPFPCTSMWGNRFRPEYTAQAHALRALTGLNGRLTWWEQWIERKPIDNNVHWEVSIDGDRQRIDILVHDPETDTDTILEVKRYRGPQTTVDVDAQLARYEQNMLNQGVVVTRNSELNDIGWAVTYRQPPSLGDTFRGDFDGRQWWAWADPEHPGHIYFAPEEDREQIPEWVTQNAWQSEPSQIDQIEENPFPVPIPVPVPVPVPV